MFPNVNSRRMGDEAKRFRNLAKECRTLAQSARDMYSKLDLLNIARQLEEEADKIDREEQEAASKDHRSDSTHP